MTLMINIGTAFAVFIVSVVILSTNYKTVWPAPNYVTHSATFDFIFQDIAQNSFSNQIDIEYAYKSSPITTSTFQLINNTNDITHHEELLLHQSILEKQSNLHHLLHIPPWALVPDRISSTTGSISDLFKIFDSISSKQENVLSVLSEMIEIIPTESIIKSHMEKLTISQKYWIKNMSVNLFNASQTIYSYQLINYAEEIQEWIQNSPYSNDYLRLLFERTRGLPLLYNPSIPQQLDAINIKYEELCGDIINSMDDTSISISQCIFFLDFIIPWMPDKSPTLSTMWPTYYDVDVDLLKTIKGINDPYTLVIKQNRMPSGEVLHYVSSKGDERIQVEWFNQKYHLRATNLAFVRRIRIQIKKIANILKNSVTLSGEIDEDDDFASFWASLETEIEEGPKPSDRHIEKLPEMFKEYIKNYAAELEKGQFEKILNMDLAQNDNVGNKDIFIHGLPSIATFNDGGIKRAWNFILGIIDHDLIENNLINKNDEFINFMDIDKFQSLHHKIKNTKIEFEILGIWPYSIGGYLRTITPEIATYSYPPWNDAKKIYGKQRYILLLDVLDKLYTNNMRQIGIQRLINNDNAKLITLKSTIKYISNLLYIEHEYFHNHNQYKNKYTLKQGLFIRLNAFIQCIDDNNDDINDKFGCLLSGIMYNIIEAFNRENQFSLVFIAFLEKEEIIKWEKKTENKKDVINVINGKDINKLIDKKKWDQWKNKYFINNDNDTIIDKLKQQFIDNENKIKLYKRMIRHISKYSILRRPGEDTFTLN